MCSHHLTINARLKQDPSRTGSIIRAYERDLVARFRALKVIIKKSVVDDDCFNLTNRLIGHVEVPPMAPAGKFVFTTVDQKVDSFMDWLEEQVDKGILEVTEREGRKVVARHAWQDKYVRSAYIKGLEQSSATLEKAGVEPGPIGSAFYRPWHTDRIGIIYTRNYRALRGITEAMDAQISRVLAEGLSQGLGALDIAKKITNRVDKIGIVRARVLARTEVMNAHAEATLNELQEFGVDVVGLKVEWSTAGWGVCPECQAHAGKVYTIEQARGVLPFHPNCRCVWIPANVGEKRAKYMP